jgi:putative addiction module killer protein
MSHYKILTTKEYDKWYYEQTKKDRVQIDSRLIKIKNERYFGLVKDLENYLYELKWTGGRRIYFAYLEEYNILLLLGGNKNGQTQDINKARKILAKNTEA